MKRLPVESSNLASVGYDQKEQILEIEFNHGGIYQYFDVPVEEYEGLMSADSHGRYFVHNIKDAYEFDRIK
jgi:KTSC domain